MYAAGTRMTPCCCAHHRTFSTDCYLQQHLTHVQMLVKPPGNVVDWRTEVTGATEATMQVDCTLCVWRLACHMHELGHTHIVQMHYHEAYKLARWCCITLHVSLLRVHSHHVHGAYVCQRVLAQFQVPDRLLIAHQTDSQKVFFVGGDIQQKGCTGCCAEAAFGQCGPCWACPAS